LRSVGIFLGFGLLGFGICAAQSAAPAPVAVTGRVLNTVTGYYVRSAEVRLDGTDNIVYTEDGGDYRIEVPAGPVTLTASYAGTQSSTLTLDAAPGAPNILDFELRALATLRARPGAADDKVVMLEAFTVSAERTGQARAIQEQRAAINVKTVIATDNFGELTQGNMGEFLKYMPGITLDFGESEATGVRIGGLDPKYTGFSADGVNLASAQDGGSRAFNLSSASITGIESIEFNQTLTADMDPSATAGNINLKSKYSFNISKNTFRYQITLDGTTDAFAYGRDYMPNDKLARRINPGFMVNYGGTFLNNRLGIEASVSRYDTYVLQTFNELNYSYYVGDLPASLVTSPAIGSITWRAGSSVSVRTAVNLSLDYKITPRLILSLRGNHNVNDGEYINFYNTLRAYNTTTYAPTVSVLPDSTLTNWVVSPASTTSGDSLLFGNSSRHRTKRTNQLFSPRLIYKNGPLDIEFRGAYTRARTEWLDDGELMFRGNIYYILGTGWTAGRPSEGSPAWTITQTDGMDWRVPQNYGRGRTSDDIYMGQNLTKNDQLSGYLDVTYAARVFGHPVTFKAGGGVRHNDYSYIGGDPMYRYVGPTGLYIESPLPTTKNYILDYKHGNITEQNWAITDIYEMGRIYMAHPEWFQYNAAYSHLAAMIRARSATEDIGAACIEATSRYKKWQFNLGARYEATSTEAQVTRMRPDADITAARALATQEQIDTGMFDNTASIAGIDFKYYNGERASRDRDYGNLFLSGGLKYDITKNLRFQLSASQSILRPNYSDIAGVLQVFNSERDTDIWVPNPIIKPELATKYYAGLKYYLNPAGSVGLSAYRLDIRDKQLTGMQITAEQAEKQMGFPLRDALDLVKEDTGSGGSGGPDESGDNNTDVIVNYAPILYRSTINVPGTRTIYGVTFDYDQQLTFLPGPLKGLGVFGSYTWSEMQNAEADQELIGVIKHSANGGVKYRYRRFNIQLRANWQDDQLRGITERMPGKDWILNDHLFQKSRIMWDLSGGFNLGRDIDFVFSVRNVFNAPLIFYSNERGRMRQYFESGSIWSLSLKGSF
jgi:TonB-dependent receptor